MNTAVEVHEVGIVARRTDGTTVRASDLLEYLDSVRVAAGVIDGARLAEPGVHTVRMALDADELVLRSDDLPASLPWQGLVRSVVHRFDTVAVVDDGVVDREGRHHDGDDLPDDLEQLVNAVADPPSQPLPRAFVHVLRTDPDIDSDAQSIANRGEATVEVVRVDGFTMIHDTLSTDPGVVVDATLRSQLPAVSLGREGDARGAVIRLRQGRGTVICHVDGGVPPELPAGVRDHATRDALLGRVSVRFESRRTFDDALVARLEAAGTGDASFAQDIAEALGIPVAAATWLEQGVAPAEPVTVVGPLSRREMLARGIHEVTGTVRTEFSREALTRGPLGGLRGFLLDHPVAALVYGLTELALAVVFLTVAVGWGVWAPVRWVLAIYFGVDGAVSLAVATLTWRRARLRA